MTELMRGGAGEEAGDGAVEEERDQKGEPEFRRPKVENQRAGDDEQGEMSAGLEPALRVTAA